VLRFFPDNLFDVLFAFQPRDHNFMPAGGTANFKIHAGTKNKKGFTPAWMRFFHLQNITRPDIHVKHPAFLNLLSLENI